MHKIARLHKIDPRLIPKYCHIHRQYFDPSQNKDFFNGSQFLYAFPTSPENVEYPRNRSHSHVHMSSLHAMGVLLEFSEKLKNTCFPGSAERREATPSTCIFCRRSLGFWAQTYGGIKRECDVMIRFCDSRKRGCFSRPLCVVPSGVYHPVVVFYWPPRSVGKAPPLSLGVLFVSIDTPYLLISDQLHSHRSTSPSPTHEKRKTRVQSHPQPLPTPPPN